MKYTRILTAIALLMVLFSCSKLKEELGIDDKEKNTTLSTSVDELSFTQQGGNETIAITSNASWKATCSGEGFSVSPGSGSGNGNITVTASPNNGYDGRTGSITISAGGISKSIKISQSYLDAIILDGDEYEFDYFPISLELKVGSTVDFVVDSPADWVSVVSTKGLTESKVVLAIAQNDTKETRETNVKISGGGIDKSVHIVQKPTTHFPESEEEFETAERTIADVMPSIKATVQEAIEQAGSGKPDEQYVANKVLELDGVVAVETTSSGNVVFMTKDSIFVNIILDAQPDSIDPYPASVGTAEQTFQYGSFEKSLRAESNNYVTPSGKKALMLLPAYDQYAFEEYFPVYYYDTIKKYLEEAGYKVDMYLNEEASIGRFRGSNLEKYDVIYVNTHGDSNLRCINGDNHSETAFLTGTKVLYSKNDPVEIYNRLRWATIISYCYNYNKEDAYYWITMDAITVDNPHFNNSWVFMHACNSGTLGAFADYCLKQGAMGYSGFTDVAKMGGSNELATNMFKAMTSGKSFSNSEAWTKSYSGYHYTTYPYDASIFKCLQRDDTPFYIVEPTDLDGYEVIETKEYQGKTYKIKRKVDQSSYHTNPDNTKFYKTNYIIEADGVTFEINEDFYIYDPGDSNDLLRAGPCLAVDSSTGVVYAYMMSKDSTSNNYTMVGYIYKLSPSGDISKQTIFSAKNYGWFPYFTYSSGTLVFNSFSYNGYYALSSTYNGSSWGSISIGSYIKPSDFLTRRKSQETILIY